MCCARLPYVCSTSLFVPFKRRAHNSGEKKYQNSCAGVSTAPLCLGTAHSHTDGFGYRTDRVAEVMLVHPSVLSSASSRAKLRVCEHRAKENEDALFLLLALSLRGCIRFLLSRSQCLLLRGFIFAKFRQEALLAAHGAGHLVGRCVTHTNDKTKANSFSLRYRCWSWFPSGVSRAKWCHRV